MKSRILVLALVLILTVGGVALWRGLSAPDETAPPPAQPDEIVATETDAPDDAPAAPRVRPYADSPDADAIDAALLFLRQHDESHLESWQVYALLNYLYRRFDLDPRFAITETFDAETHPDHDEEMIRLMGRFAQTDYVASLDVIDGEETELSRLMARALYCDHYPVDQAYVDRLGELLEMDGLEGFPGYIRTHIMLSIHWMDELSCGSDFPELDVYRDAFPDILVDIVEQGDAATDLAFEAMALLYYFGHGHRVQPQWIAGVRELQRPTGAWAYTPEDSDHGHPTAFAVWVLLEEALPDAPRTPWLVQ